MTAGEGSKAVRALVRGDVQGVGFRYSTRAQARRLGVLGWVRNGEPGEVLAHLEGPAEAVEQLLGFFRAGPPASRVEQVEVDAVKPERHEQFAIRGVSAGRFEVIERDRSGIGRFELRLPVADSIRVWALAKAPSTNPALKRIGVAVDPRLETGGTVWDAGAYEQGGRVGWPEAIERGHAVFVLHGEKLRGGFALQRTRSDPKPQWLLIKRRDEHAGS